MPPLLPPRVSAPVLDARLAARLVVLLALGAAACGPTTKEIGRENTRRAAALESSGDTDAALAAYADAVRSAGRADARVSYTRLAAARLDRRVAEASAMGDREAFEAGLGHLQTLGTWIAEASALQVALAEPASTTPLRVRLRTGAAVQRLAAARAAFDAGADVGNDDTAIREANRGLSFQAGGSVDTDLADLRQRARDRAATRVSDDVAALLRADRPFDALTRLSAAYAYTPSEALVAGLNQQRTAANQRAAEIRLAEASADGVAPERAFEIAADGLRYTASRGVREQLEATYATAAEQSVEARVNAAEAAVEEGDAATARESLAAAERFATTDALRGTLVTATRELGTRAIDAAFSAARSRVERGAFDDAYRALDAARPFREGDLAGRFDQARGDLVLVHADALDTGGRPDAALDLLARERDAFVTDGLRRRAVALSQAARVNGADLAFERAAAWAGQGRLGAADTALAYAAQYGVPGLAARLDSARARLLLDRAEASLVSRRYRAALDLATRLDTAQRTLPRGIRARQSSLRERIVEAGRIRVLVLPVRGGEGVEAATLDALDLRVRAAYGDAHPLVGFVPLSESDRALARLPDLRALADGDALALARTLRASVVVLVDVAAADTVGGAANTDPTAADGPPVRRIETTFRMLDARDRRELVRETTAARGQAGLAPDPRHDAIGIALMTRLLARLEALVP